MVDQRRDWDKEMAAIDQVIAKGGYVAPSGAAPVIASGGGGSASPVAAQPAGRGAWLGMWARTLLGLGLVFGLVTWPWVHRCGLNLYVYLGAIALLALTGLWVMRVSWVRRSGLSHFLGLLMLAYATWLGAGEILPRVGYAKSVQSWSCPN